MTTIVRVDDPWIASKAVVGEPGLGVLGSDIPSTGEHGPSILYNDISLPTEANDYFRALITSVPVGLTIFVYEDGSFEADGADGTYSVGYIGYKNGTSYGATTASITLGATGTDVSGAGAISSAEAFGTAVVTWTASVSGTGISSSEAFGTAAVSSDTGASISATGIDTAEAFGTATLTVTFPSSVSPTGISSGEAFGTATATFGVNLSMTGVYDGAVGRPRVSSNLVTIYSGVGSSSVLRGESVGGYSVGDTGVSEFFTDV